MNVFEYQCHPPVVLNPAFFPESWGERKEKKREKKEEKRKEKRREKKEKKRKREERKFTNNSGY